MNPWVLWVVLAIIAFIGIAYSMRSYSSKKSYQVMSNVTHKLFLQSPEYRFSTKCFDCVREQSHMYLQKSHGRPVMHVGL